MDSLTWKKAEAFHIEVLNLVMNSKEDRVHLDEGCHNNVIQSPNLTYGWYRTNPWMLEAIVIFQLR